MVLISVLCLNQISVCTIYIRYTPIYVHCTCIINVLIDIIQVMQFYYRRHNMSSMYNEIYLVITIHRSIRIEKLAPFNPSPMWHSLRFCLYTCYYIYPIGDILLFYFGGILSSHSLITI